MSGTSLDGLDLALVKFSWTGGKWCFEVLKAETVSYDDELSKSLREAIDYSAEKLELLDRQLGHFIGEKVTSFCKDQPFVADFVASHGHTIFHQPEKGVTLQIGDAQSIKEVCGLPVINNFRQQDVNLGGQGAPLVPIGDRDLFSEYDICINLGGIANLSFQAHDARRAFDVCPFNMALNEIARSMGLHFDDGGRQASRGKVDTGLLEQLNAVPYLHSNGPKSLGFEDYRKFWQRILNDSDASATDKLRTFVEHAAIQIARAIDQASKNTRVLITGGGTFNAFFLSRLKQLSNADLVVPDEIIINYKEALVFAYLGLLRFHDLPNCLASVTGARADSSGGDKYGFEDE